MALQFLLEFVLGKNQCNAEFCLHLLYHDLSQLSSCRLVSVTTAQFLREKNIKSHFCPFLRFFSVRLTNSHIKQKSN